MTQATLDMRQQRSSLDWQDWVRTKELRSQPNTPLSFSENPNEDPSQLSEAAFPPGPSEEKFPDSVTVKAAHLGGAKALISQDQLGTWGQSISSATK